MKLTPKQKLFCQNYLANGFNASRAARDAGYSPKTAFRTGQENLQKHAIKLYIKNSINEKLTNVDEAAVDLLRRLDSIIDSDLGDFIQIEEVTVSEAWRDKETGEEHPEQKALRAVARPTAGLDTKVLSEIHQTQFGIKIKTHDKLKAMELKGKYLKLWSDGYEIAKQESQEEQLSREERQARILELTKKRNGID